MEDGETRSDDGNALVRNIRDPGQPTESERRGHVNTQRPYRSWCKFSVMGRGVNSPHGRSDAQDDVEGMLHVSINDGFLGERESEEQVTPVLVIRGRRHKMTWAMLVPRRGTEFPWIAKRATKFIDHAQVRQRASGEGNRTSSPRRKPDRSGDTTLGEGKSNEIIERVVGLVASEARTLKAALEHRTGTAIPPDARILCWLVEFAAYLMNR